MIEKGANEECKEKVLAAVYSGDVGCLRLAVSMGCDLASIYEDNWSLLHIAACCGDTLIIDTLIECGLNPNIRSIGGVAALLGGVVGNQLGAISRLLELGTDPNLEPAHGETTSLQSACLGGLKEVVATLVPKCTKKYLNQVDSTGQSALLYAIYADNPAIVEILVQAGADINGREDWLVTPLGSACQKLNAGLVSVLIALGADADCRDSCGLSPKDWLQASKGSNKQRYREIIHLLYFSKKK